MLISDSYSCYGHFYDIYFSGEKISECRSVLEIVRKTTDFTITGLSQSIPDAIAIMMNPGTSVPVSEIPEIINLETFILDFNSKKLVITIPDNTQSRIMKIMNCFNWNHVRVINLSDIREKKSGKLGKLIKDFERNTSCDRHTIFSNTRTLERGFALSDKSVPLLLAWGTKGCIKKYATECLSILSNRQIFGIPSMQEEIFYHHPLTTKLSWYSIMKQQLE